MKTTEYKKTKLPTKKQIINLFVAIEKFRENNAKYLLLPQSQSGEAIFTLKIITTDNTNIKCGKEQKHNEAQSMSLIVPKEYKLITN